MSVITAIIKLASSFFSQLFKWKFVTPVTLPSPEPSPAPITPPKMDTTNDKIYKTAFSLLGQDASPFNRAPQALACAESISYIYSKATGQMLTGHPILSVIELNDVLRASPRFKPAIDPTPGSIILALTYIKDAVTHHGHAGICGNYHIMSNNSLNGRFEANYTIPSFLDRFKGFRIFIYEAVDSGS